MYESGALPSGSGAAPGAGPAQEENKEEMTWLMLRDRERERGYKQGQRERERRGGVKRGGHDVHNKYKANREEQKKRTGAARQSVSQSEGGRETQNRREKKG